MPRDFNTTVKIIRSPSIDSGLSSDRNRREYRRTDDRSTYIIYEEDSEYTECMAVEEVIQPNGNGRIHGANGNGSNMGNGFNGNSVNSANKSSNGFGSNGIMNNPVRVPVSNGNQTSSNNQPNGSQVNGNNGNGRYGNRNGNNSSWRNGNSQEGSNLSMRVNVPPNVDISARRSNGFNGANGSNGGNGSNGRNSNSNGNQQNVVNNTGSNGTNRNNGQQNPGQGNNVQNAGQGNGMQNAGQGNKINRMEPDPMYLTNGGNRKYRAFLKGVQCTYCNLQGHEESECMTKARNNKEPFRPYWRCPKCRGEYNGGKHYAQDCPKNTKNVYETVIEIDGEEVVATIEEDELQVAWINPYWEPPSDDSEN
jgi:hypothetical protein